MDQIHEDHLARILENRSRRGVLGVYTSEASKRLYEAAQQHRSSATAGTQTRPPPPPPPLPQHQPPASAANGTSSPTRPFRYPPSNGHAAMPSPNSLFDTILNHSTADLYSEDGAAASPSALLQDDRLTGGHYDSHQNRNDAAATQGTRPPLWPTLGGPGWQQASPLSPEAAAPSAPSRWRTTPPTTSAPSASAETGDSAARVPLCAYRGRAMESAAARPAGPHGAPPPPPPPSSSPYAAGGSAPTSARSWSAPRGFTSLSGLLQTPRWQASERQPSVPVGATTPTTTEPSRWRTSPSSLGYHPHTATYAHDTNTIGAYPSVAPVSRRSFDPNRSAWFSRTLQESYPLPIVRDEEDGGLGGWRRGPPSGQPYCGSFSPYRAPQQSGGGGGGGGGIAEAVRWTDDPAAPAPRAARQPPARATRASRRAVSPSSASSSPSASSSAEDASSSDSEAYRSRRSRRGERRRRGRSSSSRARGRTSKTPGRYSSRSRRRRGGRRDSEGTASESALSGQSGQSGRADTEPPSDDGWARGPLSRTAGINPSAAGAVVYTGDRESGGGVQAFPVSRNQPPRHPPRVRTLYEDAPIGLPDVRSTIDIRTSVQVLMAGDWFFKWDRKGSAVHQRWVWVDAKSYLLVWSRKETHDSLFSGSVPLETVSQVTPRELVQVAADGLPRNYYVLMIETTRRVLQLATERKEKADVWYEALNNVVAFVRRREMNKGALIPD